MTDEATESPEIDWRQRLRDLRRLMAWSQRAMAKEFRVTPAAVSQWESGQRSVPGPIQRLVEVYERDLGMIDPPVSGARKVNGSWIDRTLRASALSAGIAGRLAGGSVRSIMASDARAGEIKAATQVAIAEQLAEVLGELKGGLMKIGQMLSYTGVGLTEPAREALRGLQDDVAPIDPGAVNAVFLETFGDLPERVFAKWDPSPIAAASIGQVHAAVTQDGQSVAVKVQYPGVRESITADLRNAKLLERIAGLFFRQQDQDALVGELRDRFNEECDYTTEAQNQMKFADLYADDPEVIVPEVYSELSNDRVLTTQLVVGDRFDAFMREADQEAKDRAGATIFRFAFESIFRHQIFNADPHPGNYIFTERGPVAFLDFGCVKRFSAEYVCSWARVLRGALAGDPAEIKAGVLAMGFIPQPEKVDFDAVQDMILELHEPWLSKTPFRFNRYYVDKTWRSLVTENPHRYRMKMRAEALFSNRLQWGMYNILADLGAQADWRAIIEDILS